MSEQASFPAATPAAWTLGFAPGHPVVPGGMDPHLHGGVASGDPRVRSGFGGVSDRGSRSSGGSIINRGGGRPTPQWYRRLVATISVLSIFAVTLLLVTVR